MRGRPASFYLQAEGVAPPSEATIWRVLSRWGFVLPAPEKAPKHAHRRFAAERANQLWQIDDTPWPLADGTEVAIINVIDDCTPGLDRLDRHPSLQHPNRLFGLLCRGGRVGLAGPFPYENATEFRFGLAEALRLLGIVSNSPPSLRSGTPSASAWANAGRGFSRVS
ncbi:MAG: hypothetical protein LC739_04850 [Actinobacteria bacterium]|nr:hypothetical protein [Actinomycetota bacterium]